MVQDAASNAVLTALMGSMGPRNRAEKPKIEAAGAAQNVVSAGKKGDWAWALKHLQDVLRGKLPLQAQGMVNGQYDKADEIIRSLFPAEEQPKRSKILGGAHKDIEADGGERHHMPADSVSPLSEGEGPAIWMEKADHCLTRSWGNSIKAQKYRAAQAELINQGKFREAMQMDIDDIRSQFGNKYDPHIQQMLDYYNTIPAWKLRARR